MSTEPEHINPTSATFETTANHIAKPKPKRGEDFGQSLLPGMDQFQLLTRKVKQPLRLLRLIEHLCDLDLPQELKQQVHSAKAALPPRQRTQEPIRNFVFEA